MNEKINLQDIVNQLSEKQGLNKKEAELFVKSMFDLIEEALANEKYVKIKGLGTFKLTEVVSRESINVNTGERFEIQGHTKISFTPDTVMKELINKPFSHFETVILNDDVVLEDTITEETETTEVKPASNIETEENNIEETIVSEETPTETTPEEVAKEEEVIVEQTVIEEIIEKETIAEEPVADINETSILVEETQIVESPEESPTEAKEEEKPLEEEKPQEEPEQTLQPIHPSEKTIAEVKEKKSSPILLGIIIALILIILFGGYWLFLKPSTEKVNPTPVTPKEVVVPTETKTEKPSKDTISAKVEPETTTPPSTMPATTPMQAPINEKVPSLADTLDYRITGTKTTYTLQNGETIIKASVKFFGTKKFWPYIVIHNQKDIKDADNIPAGTTIKIPELTPKH